MYTYVDIPYTYIIFIHNLYCMYAYHRHRHNISLIYIYQYIYIYIYIFIYYIYIYIMKCEWLKNESNYFETCKYYRLILQPLQSDRNVN